MSEPAARGAFLRPAEWVVVGFLAYCGIRLAITGNSGVPAAIAFPSADIVAAALAFVLLKLWLPRLREMPPRVRLWAGLGGAALFVVTLFSLEAPKGDLEVPMLSHLRPLFLALDAAAILALSFMRGPFRSTLDSLRDWLGPVALLCFYPLVPIVMAGTPDRDSALMAIDRFLFLGADPSHLMEHLISGPLSEWMALCYSLYIAVILVGLGALYLRDDPRPFRELAFAMTLALACGYAGYTLVPARGPMFTEHFDVDLSLYYLKGIKELLMDQLRVPRDCFPSLHTGVTWVVTAMLYRHARPLFRLFFPVALTMPFACIYLRYHYATDVLAGLALAAISVGVAVRLNWSASNSKQPA